MPTTKPRYTFTDTGHLSELLDAAQQRWPDADRKELLLRLAKEGGSALKLGDERMSAEERHSRTREALQRIPSLVDADLLLSEEAWS